MGDVSCTSLQGVLMGGSLPSSSCAAPLTYLCLPSLTPTQRHVLPPFSSKCRFSLFSGSRPFLLLPPLLQDLFH